MFFYCVFSVGACTLTVPQTLQHTEQSTAVCILLILLLFGLKSTEVFYTLGSG